MTAATRSHPFWSSLNRSLHLLIENQTLTILSKFAPYLHAVAEV